MAQLAKRNRKFNKSCAPPNGYTPSYQGWIQAPCSYTATLDRQQASRIRRGVEGKSSVTHKPSTLERLNRR